MRACVRPALAGVVAAVVCAALAAPALADPFASCKNKPESQVIACENALPGTPASEWQVTNFGDLDIQGYATSMSVNRGQTIQFKINTPSTAYHIDIYRLGYYGGDGARLIQAGLQPSATLPQTQPACLTNTDTGLIDCGNWGVSASWAVPADAVSGVYIAHLVRDDAPQPKNGSQIVFVVRNDDGHADLLVQTSDATWQAYNTYGGNSLYQCASFCPPGNPAGYKGAFAVSYNRPFQTASRTFLYATEYPMIRFLEANGYDVSYISEPDVASNPGLLLSHKAFMSSGHDEYWSQEQVDAVTRARDAGVDIAFFSGNEIFWKTRWTPSTDGSNTPFRTIVCYKETHFNQQVDPTDPPGWTGTWADPRFQAHPEPGNALSGQYPEVVDPSTTDITVPSQFAHMRFWRNTAVAGLAPGQSLTLAPGTGTVGYEWDVDADNGFRPAGLFDLSRTVDTSASAFTDYGTLTTSGTSTEVHSLTLYRAASGALVFGTGTMQWSWGLDADNPSRQPPDRNMQQATVNLLADMHVTPQTLLSGLVSATPSTDTSPPVSDITLPASGSAVPDGTQVTISGGATDIGGGVVAGVEVSTDGGQTWHPAQGTTSWSYTWVANHVPSATILSRAVDDSGNIETPSDPVTISIGCPCSLLGNKVPLEPDSGDTGSVEVGMRFSSDVGGYINGIRFYKAPANGGTHTADLWTDSGTLLAQTSFTNETGSGWQEATFAQPVYITPGTTYVASTFDPQGHYAFTGMWWYPPPSPAPVGGGVTDSPPLHAPLAINGQVNGLYRYVRTPAFPNKSAGSNYWVDVDFSPGPPPPPGSSSGGSSATSSTAKKPLHAPRITAFSQSASQWARTKPRAARGHARKKKPRLAVGTVFRFTLDQAADVQLVFLRDLKGIWVGKRCLPRGKPHGVPHSCVQAVPAGVISLHSLPAGPNKTVFFGVIRRGHRLGVGPYEVIVKATNAAGQTGSAGPLRFSIVS